MRRLFAVLGSIVALSMPAPVLAAPSPAPVARLEVFAGWEGLFSPVSPVPVRIRVEADRLVRGTLRVYAQEFRHVTLPVEVPGASVKELRTVVEPTGVSGDTIFVQLRDDRDRVLARQEVSIDFGLDIEVVGVLPRALGSRPVPAATPLVPDAGVARFTKLTDDDLALGPDVLRRIGTIAADPSDLSGLSPAARGGLLRWIERGGRLVVDATDGSSLSVLPEAWRPPTGEVRAGRGEVALARGAVAAGRWAEIVEPTRSVPGGDAAGVFPTANSLANALAEDADVRPVNINWLFATVMIYVALIGPVLYAVLRRGRREPLAWVAIPIAAVAFTAVSAFVAGIARGTARASHATVLDTGAGGASAMTFVGVSAPSGGERRVGFPRGWSPASLRDGTFGSQGAVSFESTQDGPLARLPLNPGQFGTTAASGTATGDGLTVTAVAESGRISGTVRNATSFSITNAGVIVGKNTVSVGTLRPGQQRSWSTDAEPSGAHFRSPGWDLWPVAAVDVRRAGPVRYELWALAGRWLGEDLVANGDAVAVGWTRDYHPPVAVDGRHPRLDGSTLVLSRAAVGAPDGTAPVLSVRREQLRGPGTMDGEPGSDLVSSQTSLVMRFTFPSAPAAPLVLHGPADANNVDVWDGSAWRTVGGAGNAGAAGGDQPDFGRRIAPGFPAPQFFGKAAPAEAFQNQPEVAMADFDVGPISSTVVYVRIGQTSSGPHTQWAWTLREKS